MAMQPNETSQIISEIAKQEGSPTSGSESAEMQSQVDKIKDANLLKSREARATGQAQPPKDSVSADAQRLASANERGVASSTGSLQPGQQSHLAKEQNFQQAASEIGSKMINDPDHVTKADGDLMHSREQRAHGHTEKGGIAAQAQKLASENAAKGMV
ncbi:hypothetical protein MBLNU459_g5496t1 [Dothideomycetes sp. NU459]